MRTPGCDPRLGVRSAGETGFVLIPVLAALFLLALAAVVLTKSVTLDIRLVSMTERRAVVEELADGVTRLAAYYIGVNVPGSGKSGDIRLDGIPQTCRIKHNIVSISFLDTDGQININRAPIALLQKILSGLGLSDDEARRMAENITDFRTRGDASLAGGSKIAAYQGDGHRHGPKYAEFASVGELDQVIGMTPALLARLKPLVTVHSRFATVNPQVASLPVLRALAGAEFGSDSATPEALDDLRSKIVIPVEFTYIPRTRGNRTTTSSTYVTRVVVNHPGKVAFARQAVIELNGNTPTFKEWTEISLPPQIPASNDINDLPDCIGGTLGLLSP